MNRVEQQQADEERIDVVDRLEDAIANVRHHNLELKKWQRVVDETAQELAERRRSLK
jgi:hypothetical protein